MRVIELKLREIPITAIAAYLISVPVALNSLRHVLLTWPIRQFEILFSQLFETSIHLKNYRLWTQVIQQEKF